MCSQQADYYPARVWIHGIHVARSDFGRGPLFGELHPEDNKEGEGTAEKPSGGVIPSDQHGTVDGGTQVVQCSAGLREKCPWYYA